VAHSGLNITIQKSLQWCWVPHSCWLVFFYGAQELRSVHSADVLCHNISICIKSFKNVSKLKYLRITLANRK